MRELHEYMTNSRFAFTLYYFAAYLHLFRSVRSKLSKGGFLILLKIHASTRGSFLHFFFFELWYGGEFFFLQMMK